METNKVDWESYAHARLLGRNRLLYEHHQEVVKDFLYYFAALSPDLKIFDIGCSGGFFLVLLRELGFTNLEGADISKKFISYAQTKGLNCNNIDVLGGNIPESSRKSVDVVMLMDILEHLEDPAGALQTCKQLLKPGGIVYITVPIYDSLSEKLARLFKGKTRLQQAQEHDPTHIQAWTEADFHAVVKQAGFAVVESKRHFCDLSFLPKRRLREAVSLLLPGFVKGKFLRVIAKP